MLVTRAELAESGYIKVVVAIIAAGTALHNTGTACVRAGARLVSGLSPENHS